MWYTHRMTDSQERIKYWRAASRRDLKTAEGLLGLKRYDACLFFGHLAVEKLLKGLVEAHTKSIPPYTHDLERLGKLASLSLSDIQLADLRTITEFNIAGRYDDAKHAFYKRCTPTYTRRYFAIITTLCVWLEKQFPKQ
jgi:HEPN domain-containing protein